MHTFIDDIFFKDLLYGLTVRSGIPRARIMKISLPPLPEGYLAVTARDIPGYNLLSAYGTDMPFLAESRVNYIGEPVLLLAGVYREMLDELASRIQIDYKAEQPVMNMERAGTRGSSERVHFIRGDPKAAFRNAYQIVEGKYAVEPRQGNYAEPQGAVSFWDGKMLTVYASSLDPFAIHGEMARLLSLSRRKIQVIVPRLGRHLQGKGLPALMAAGHAALLSFSAGKAVKLVYESFGPSLFSPRTHPALIRHKTALDREGNPLAMKVELLLDAGAYRSDSSQVLVEAALAACGSYACANIEVEAKLVLTNKVPAGFYGVMGRPRAFFAAELHTARLEEISQADPYIWRKKNLLSAGHVTVTGSRLKGRAGAIPVLEEVVQASDFRRKHAAFTAMKKRRKSLLDSPNPLRGIGLSVCNQGIGYLGCGRRDRNYSLRVVLGTDKKCRIYSSLVDIGQGLSDMFRHLAAGILDLDPSRVIIEAVNTKAVPDTGPTTLAGTIHIGAKLLAHCCLVIQKRRFTSSLPIEVKRTHKAPKRLSWDPESLQGDPYESYSWAGIVIELEVDPVSLQTITQGIWAVYDAGPLWNAEWAKAQAESSILKALGYASDYRETGFMDITPLTVKFLEGGKRQDASGQDPAVQAELSRGFDELALSGIPPAYASAVFQATGLYIDQIPITPEVIQECLKIE